MTMGTKNAHDDVDIEMNRTPNEEAPPLYSETSKATPTSVPDITADREAVRDFFINLLVSIRHDSNECAHAIASKWHGTGRELKSYPPEMFLQVLGHEAGWFIYRETKLLRLRSTPENAKKERIKKGKCALPKSNFSGTLDAGLTSAVCLTFFWVILEGGLIATVIHLLMQKGNSILIGFLVLFGLFIFLCIGVSIHDLCYPHRRLEAAVDAELNACMRRQDPKP